jgi:hypothetical protein
MELHDVSRAIDDDRLEELVDTTESFDDLNVVHNALFDRCLERGIPRQALTKKIEEATYIVARESMLDERDIRQMSRKALQAYDPKLAVRVYKTQIAAMYESLREAL